MMHIFLFLRRRIPGALLLTYFVQGLCRQAIIELQIHRYVYLLRVKVHDIKHDEKLGLCLTL